jgi:CBS domain-containing protein
MKTENICQRPVITIRSSDEVIKAAQLMREKHVGYLVVVESDSMRPIGVLTDRDIVVSVVAREVDPATMRVADVMSPRPITAAEDESVEEALGKMRQFGIRRLPVVNRRDELVGILATDDVLRALAVETQDIATAIGRERQIEEMRRS